MRAGNKSQVFAGKRFCVLGFGVEGRGVTSFLFKQGASVAVYDQLSKDAFDERTVAGFESHGVSFVCGDIPDFSSFDFIVRSPGVKSQSSVFQRARASGAEITTATSLFFSLCPCPIIGVSGTKGKGTTTTLIYEMLLQAGRDAHIGGNIGVSPFAFLDKLTPKSRVVLELSSFQLSDLRVSPHIAVLLMIVPEHLDYHEDFESYIRAKKNIVRFQTESDFAIFNQDYPVTNESDIETKASVYKVSREGPVLEGCYVESDSVHVRLSGKHEEILPISDVKIPGAHNLDNVCAASLVAYLEHVSVSDIRSVLTRFGGLEHRLEFVRDYQGVAFYNDSFSTIPETCVAAIQSFEEPKVLILGGSSKDSSFDELGNVISSTNIRAIIGIGSEWRRIKETITNPDIKMIEGIQDMQEVVSQASSVAQRGDVVLLSPACASFGMFSDYKERGNQFKKAVMSLS